MMLITAPDNLLPVNITALPALQVKQDFQAALSGGKGKGQSRKVAFSTTIPPAQSNTSWNGLEAGKTYVLRLIATNDAGSSFADHPFDIVAAPPTVGVVVSQGQESGSVSTYMVLPRSHQPTPQHSRLWSPLAEAMLGLATPGST